MTSDSDIITPIEPVSPRPTEQAYAGLALWFIIIGGIIFALFAIAMLIFTLRGLVDDGSLAERLSGIPLYLFVGSFGMVPGGLLYIWGRSLKRHGPSKALAVALPVFALPLIGLAVFVTRFDGWFYGGLAVLCVAAFVIVSAVIWRVAAQSNGSGL